MTQTTELQATETQSEVTAKLDQKFSEGAVKAYINGHVESPKGSWLAIKTVVPCRFYRLNFLASNPYDNDIVPVQKFVDSRFIEIVHTPQGLNIVDRTLKSKPKDKLFW